MAEQDLPYRRAKSHHFLQHDLPRLSKSAVLILIGASSISEALDWLENRKPAELRDMFEKVYKASTKSQNKRWLQRRLAEALRLKPSQYFPLSNKKPGSQPIKAAPATYPSSSSAALPAPSNSATAELLPVRKSTRIPKLRAFARLGSTEPCTPTAAEVESIYPTDRKFVEERLEEGNDDSETAVASLDSQKNRPAATASAGGGADGFTSGVSPHPSSPRPTAAASVPPTLAPIPPLSAADAYKILSNRGPGAHTKDSAAEVAAIVAAKKRLKAFLPGYPMSSGVSEDQAAVLKLFQANYEGSLQSRYINAPILPSFLASAVPALSYEPSSIIVGSAPAGAAAIHGTVSNNTVSHATATASGSGNGSDPSEEEDDEIFMKLDPVLVDLDMSLLPDGRMW